MVRHLGTKTGHGSVTEEAIKPLYSPASCSPTDLPGSRRGKLAGKRMGQRQRPEFASKLGSHGSATKPLWEACWQANEATPEARIRQQAALPRICHEVAVGSLLASEYPNTREPEFASKLLSHGSATKPPWEACWQANGATPEARIRQQAGLPRICHEAAVGSLLASEWGNAEGRNSPASWAPTDLPRSRCGKRPGRRSAWPRMP